MPNSTHTRIAGRAVLAGLLALGGAAAANAGATGTAPQDPLIVSQSPGDARVVPVAVADLDLASAYDRETLGIRIAKAARRVCDVHGGSKLDRLPDADVCVDQARSGALAQLEARGQTLALAGSGTAAQ